MIRSGFTICFLAAPLFLAVFGCSEISDPADTEATITVLVQFGDTSIPGKKVELLETGEAKETDQRGRAEFKVIPGRYTLRVYGINRGGPGLLNIDLDVEARASETSTIRVFDCPPCV